MPLIYNTRSQPPTVPRIAACRRERVLRSYRHFCCYGGHETCQDTTLLNGLGTLKNSPTDSDTQ